MMKKRFFDFIKKERDRIKAEVDRKMAERERDLLMRIEYKSHKIMTNDEVARGARKKVICSSDQFIDLLEKTLLIRDWYVIESYPESIFAIPTPDELAAFKLSDSIGSIHANIFAIGDTCFEFATFEDYIRVKKFIIEFQIDHVKIVLPSHKYVVESIYAPILEKSWGIKSERFITESGEVKYNCKIINSELADKYAKIHYEKPEDKK